MNISYSKFKNYFILFNISTFIFFFDIKYIFEIKFDFRFIILSLSFFLVQDIFIDIKKKNLLLFF